VSTDAKPNLVVIMADQHRADALGCAGNPTVDTPHIDRLAAEGVRFSRTSCQGPLCMPARASFLTERYVRDHGVYTNWAEVPDGISTHVRAVRDAAYHTTMLGKAHLTRDDELTVDHVDELAPRLHAHGYTEVIESGDKFNVEVPNRYTDALGAAGLLDAYRAHIADRSYHGENESGVGATKQVPMWDATPAPLPLDLYIDQWHGDLAVDWIRRYDRDDPFYLFVGFPGPHDPWDAPTETMGPYLDRVVRAPRSTRRPDLEPAGAYGQLLRGMLDLSDTDTMTVDAIAAMRRAYYADITIIDRCVGRIVDTLADRGLLDNTWIVYTSDHGEMAGDHGLMSKCLLYEGAVRVPLVIRPPGGTTARVVDDLVEHLDVPATLREIVGAADLAQSDGRSLLGYLTGGRPAARTVSISENWGFASFETDRWRLVVDEDAAAPCQLFDLDADPAEDVNLVTDPAHRGALDDLMTAYVRPFLATPPQRPHPSPFAPR
jgi:arylsulfatase A-like enzyme